MKVTTKPIIITSGEPAGIGPDILLKLKSHQFSRPVIFITDRQLLENRAQRNHCRWNLPDYFEQNELPPFSLLNLPLPKQVQPGAPSLENASWILETLRLANNLCMKKTAHALVTGPVNKATILAAGFSFSGHTEFLAQLTSTKKTVMLLAADDLRVALLTSHVPLRQVADLITEAALSQCIQIINNSFKQLFNCHHPHISICGLNPHAGENGYLGTEEIYIIAPTIEKLKRQGLHLTGPIAADSAFIPEQWRKTDVILAMYHDQGLAAIKALAFKQAVNITLGLPYIRTSVDHGTAFALAGTGKADESSLVEAVKIACEMR